MNSRFLLILVVAAGFTSCSTAYKSGQTPDDVYYSPAREGAAYVELDQQRSGRYRSYENDNYSDRWLRMRVRNPYRWNAFDEYDWNGYNSYTYNWNSPYAYNWNSYWNGYWNWNSWFNPYSGNVIIINPKTNPTVYNKVRNFSLGGYTNTNYNTSNVARSKASTRLPASGYNNSNSNGLGTSVRRVFNNNNNYESNNTQNNSNNNSSRTYNPSNSNSSSSSGATRSSSSGSTGGGSSSSSSGGSGRRGG